MMLGGGGPLPRTPLLAGLQPARIIGAATMLILKNKGVVTAQVVVVTVVAVVTVVTVVTAVTVVTVVTAVTVVTVVTLIVMMCFERG